ncbi:unnamed protein product [Cuscuta campestris]|uniref:Uncharacterized protein n=1 Tax=Cuscuta campestris TaxID=132261 RepID=A0A484MYX3_9ASTE|nr:unnamed protein product [Cuscuta campestris]
MNPRGTFSQECWICGICCQLTSGELAGGRCSKGALGGDARSNGWSRPLFFKFRSASWISPLSVEEIALGRVSSDSGSKTMRVLLQEFIGATVAGEAH